jgi:putative transcriptional regulator
LDIPTLRQSLGLSQTEFGQLFGVHAMTVSKWERGIATPSAYQFALMREFEIAAAAQKQRLKHDLKQVLVGIGAVAALRLLLTSATADVKRDR